MKYYVYRFKDIHEQIVYVGKTKNINNRMKQHFSDKGHLKPEQYEAVTKVEYIVLDNKIDMDIKELYYINKWNPDFNTVNTKYEKSSLSINEDYKWIVFKSKENDEKENYINEIEKLNKELKKIKSLNNMLTSENNYLIKEKEQVESKLLNFNSIISDKIFNFNKQSSEFLLELLKTDTIDKSNIYISIFEARLLVKHFKEYRFTTIIHGKSKVTYNLFNENNSVKLEKISIEETIVEDINDDFNDTFKLSAIDFVNNTVLVSGQSINQMQEDLKKCKDLEKINKEKTEKIRDFIEKADYSTKSNLGYAFRNYIGVYYAYYQQQHDYSKIYDLIQNENIKTPKQLLKRLDELNGKIYPKDYEEAV